MFVVAAIVSSWHFLTDGIQPDFKDFFIDIDIKKSGEQQISDITYGEC